jgi:hypothetical protein
MNVAYAEFGISDTALQPIFWKLDTISGNTGFDGP